MLNTTCETKVAPQLFIGAIDGQHLDVIEWCIDDGWDIDVKDTHSHWTPLLRCGKIS